MAAAAACLPNATGAFAFQAPTPDTSGAASMRGLKSACSFLTSDDRSAAQGPVAQLDRALVS
jgi:hypothetical protein